MISQKTSANQRTFTRNLPKIVARLKAELKRIVDDGQRFVDERDVWVKQETKRQVAGCRIKSDSGIWLHTPDGIGHYKALWTRDYYYFVKYAGEFIDDENLKASIKLCLGRTTRRRMHSRSRQCRRQTHLQSRRGQETTCGPRSRQRSLFGIVSLRIRPQDWRQAIFSERSNPSCKRGWIMSGALKMVSSTILQPTRNASMVSPTSLQKQGICCSRHCLYYQACVELDDVQKGMGGDPAFNYRARADLIRKNLSILWDDQAGMYLAADKDCRQIDIWGSAYAAEVGLATDEQRTASPIIFSPTGMKLSSAVRSDTYLGNRVGNVYLWTGTQLAPTSMEPIGRHHCLGSCRLSHASPQSERNRW